MKCGARKGTTLRNNINITNMLFIFTFLFPGQRRVLHLVMENTRIYEIERRTPIAFYLIYITMH